MSKNFSIPGNFPTGQLPIYVAFVTATGDGGE